MDRRPKCTDRGPSSSGKIRRFPEAASQSVSLVVGSLHFRKVAPYYCKVSYDQLSFVAKSRCPMAQPDPLCSTCGQIIAAGAPVVFDHGTGLHLDCYVGTEGAAALVLSFLETRPGERFCHACIAQQLTRERQEIEKA